MFTGIVEAIGTVEAVQGSRISVRTPWNPAKISLGQSISVHGCCLTVVDIQNQILSFDLSEETLQKTFFSTIHQHSKVNLERAMQVGARFDGHWVTGHVDTTGIVEKISAAADQTSKDFIIGSLHTNPLYLVPKGSICVDGVSLTINDVQNNSVRITIIPYTLEHTCFSVLKEKDIVNVEFDLIGKYLTRYVEHYQTQTRTL